LELMDREIAGTPESRVLVQYVPHSIGKRAINLRFCAWLLSTSRKVTIDVMFHEVAIALRLRQPLKHTALAATQRAMTFLVTRSAKRVFVAIPAWARQVERYVRKGSSISWLPVPSNCPVSWNAEQIAKVRKHLAQSQVLVGHFSTYGPLVSEMLERALINLCGKRVEVKVLLVGRESHIFTCRLLGREPRLRGRVYATGSLSTAMLSSHLSACDLMLQPYPDGVSSRRTSVMAALAHGRPVVTTLGHLTDQIWEGSDAVALAPVNNEEKLARVASELIDSKPRREWMSLAASALYDRQFDVRHTIGALRGCA
jgi:glycosyltransferase involved in cell wall biosynthesis